MKKINLLLTSIFTLTFLFSSLNLFSQASLTVNDRTGLVEIYAKNGDEVSVLIQQFDELVLQQQDNVSETVEEMSTDQLAEFMCGTFTFPDQNGVRNSLLMNKKSAYLSMFRQFAEVEEKSNGSKEEIEYDVKFTPSEEYYLALSPGYAYIMRRINSDRTGFIVNIGGKRALIVEDNVGNTGNIELDEGVDPIRIGGEIELRGSDCYKIGFTSKFTGSYSTKWIWHSMGFAGYSKSILWGAITIQGYSSYAKVTSFAAGGWLKFFPKRYRTKLDVDLKGKIYNHKCSKELSISKSNSKSNSWFCGTAKVGVGRSTIKNNTLSSKGIAQNVGSSTLSLK